jgi:allantoinase
MSKVDLIIRNGCIVNADSVFHGDIAVKNGKIIEISEAISMDTPTQMEIDALGLHILPGLIDTHVHFNEPGRTEWEGFETGSKSLAAGGVSTFFDMPLNSSPPTTTRDGFNLKQKAAEAKSIVDYRLWGGLVPENLDSLKDLHECGVIGFKAFMSNSGMDEFQHADDITLFQGMKKVAELGSILAVHAESDVITSQLANEMKNANRLSVRDYCESRPVFSEVEAVGRMIAYAEATGCKLHIVHASSGDVVKVVAEAKSRGIDVSVETCPHYLSLTIDDFEKIGPIAKCAPPLRELRHVESLWEALIKGDIDLIGSDHSPSPSSMKENQGDMFSVWGGISGAQSTLNVLLEEGYWKRNVSLEKIVEVTSTNPAKRFGLFPSKGTVSVESEADLTIIDLNKVLCLEKKDLHYRHKQSPYIGKTFRGKVMYTLVGGRIIHESGKEISRSNA